jgi:hypothetical protein
MNVVGNGILAVGLIAAASSAYAQGPRELLKQMVEQLRASPADDALREKIIRLGSTMKPAPAVPPDAEKFEGRAQFAFNNAKSNADYLVAAQEYEKAVAFAPWVPGYYFDLCTIYEKAGKYLEAKRRCELYLLSGPRGAETSELRKRIAGLEFALERSSADAQLKRQREEFDAFLRQNEGALFNTEAYAPSKDYGQAMISGGAVFIGVRYMDEQFLEMNPHVRGKLWAPVRYAVTGFASTVPFEYTPGTTCQKTLMFTRDGQTLQTTFVPPEAIEPVNQVFQRAN